MARESVISKFCNRTGINGIPDWYNAHKIQAKLTWSLILLGAFGAIVFYSYQNVATFLQYPTVTQISVVQVDKMPFPNVTICHSGRFNKSYFEENIRLPPSTPIPAGYNSQSIRLEFVKYFSALAYQSASFAANVKEYLAKTYDFNFNSTINQGAYDLLAFVNNSAFQCEKTYMLCTFMTRYFPCCSAVRLVLSDYGICYHTQLKPVEANDTSGQAKQILTGTGGGFSHVILVPNDLFVKMNPTDSVGMRLHLGSYLEPEDQYGIHLLPAMKSIIRLNPTKRIVNPSIHPCLEAPYPLAHHETYTQGLCKSECMYNLSMTYCSCAPAGYLVQVDSQSVCSPQKMMDCFLPQLSKAKRNRKHVLSQCYDGCLQFCATLEYAPSVTYLKKIQKKTGATSLADITDINPSNDIAIFFDRFQYQQIEQQLLMTFEGFISNLGGTWGFWTGISVVGMIQCGYICLCGACEPDDEEIVEQKKEKKQEPVPKVAFISGDKK